MGFIKVKPNSKRWLKERFNGIGASEAATLWDLQYHKADNFEQWISKKAGKVDDYEETFKTRWGHHTEGAILKWAEQQLGPIKRTPGIHYFDGVPALRSTPDGMGMDLAEKPFVVDSKSSGRFVTMSFAKKPKLPTYYWVQSQQQMISTETEFGYMVINYGNDYFCYWRIDRSEFFADIHIPMVKHVWGCIEEMRENWPDYEAHGMDHALAYQREAVGVFSEQIEKEYVKTCYPWHVD